MSGHDERLAAELSSYQTPTELREALAAAARPDVHPGQVWRARVPGTSTIVVITGDFVAGSGDVVVATPGQLPPADSDVAHHVVTTTMFRSLTLWPTIRGTLHHRALDILIEHSDITTELARRFRSLPDATTSTVNLFDSGAVLIAELRDDLDRLTSAPAVPVRTATPPPLAPLLPGTASERLALLVTALAVNQHEAMELYRDRRTLTEQQARTLEAAIGADPGTLPSSAGVDPAVALEIEHPRWRAASRRRAARARQDEVTARTDLAREAYALAARESTSTPDWQQRIALLVAGES